jgi:hypothetical protein
MIKRVETSQENINITPHPNKLKYAVKFYKGKKTLNQVKYQFP